LISQTVGSYRIIEKLGEGGMGEVYLAEHKYISRRAAVKFLLPDRAGSPELLSRFFAEARAASLIEHPGICEVLDCEIHSDGRAYIVMEYLNGESLRGYLDRVGNLQGDQPGGLSICRQMAGALAAAHAQGIVHRDLKPDNAFLHLPAGRAPEEPVAKLLDFGIAKLHGGLEKGSKTRTGQLLGTPLYMSPEQCRGAREVDSRSDIYSFGCIMFEMFCGRPPFVAEGFGELIFAHMSEPPPDPAFLSPGLDASVRQLLLHCLEKAPERRPASMTELTALLAAAGAPDAVHLRTPVLRARSDAPGARTPMSLPTPGSTQVMPASKSHPSGATAKLPASVTTPLAISEPPRPRRKLVPTTLGGGATEVGATLRPRTGRRSLAIAMALAGLAAGGIFLLRGPGAVLPAAGSPSGLAPAGPSGELRSKPEVLPPPLPPPAAPELSSIRLTGLPAGATVLLDGRPVHPPLTVPRGPDDHRVSVEADGFQPWAQSFDGSSDQTLAVQLKPKVPEAHPPGKGKHKSEHRGTPSHFNGFDDLY